MSDKNWSSMSADQKADALKKNLENEINKLNKRLILIEDEIGTISAEIKSLSKKLKDL